MPVDVVDKLEDPRHSKPEEGWREKLYEIIFESHTRAGKIFDIVLIALILSNVAVIMLESIEPVYERHKILFRSLNLLYTALILCEKARGICPQFLRNNRFARHTAFLSGDILPAYAFPDADSFLQIAAYFQDIQDDKFPAGKPSARIFTYQKLPENRGFFIFCGAAGGVSGFHHVCVGI